MHWVCPQHKRRKKFAKFFTFNVLAGCHTASPQYLSETTRKIYHQIESCINIKKGDDLAEQRKPVDCVEEDSKRVNIREERVANQQEWETCSSSNPIRENVDVKQRKKNINRIKILQRFYPPIPFINNYQPLKVIPPNKVLFPLISKLRGIMQIMPPPKKLFSQFSMVKDKVRSQYDPQRLTALIDKR